MMTRVQLLFVLALGERVAIGPGGLGTSFVQQKTKDAEKQVEALHHASALLQERDHIKHHAHEHVHAHGKVHHGKKFSDFENNVNNHFADLEGTNGAFTGAQGELQQMLLSGNRAPTEVNKAFDKQAAASSKHLEQIIEKHSIPKMQPWVDHSQESIASSKREVEQAIERMDKDFFGQGSGSLLEEGADGSVPAAGGSALLQNGMDAATQRAESLTAEIAKANANFKQDFENGMAQGFRAAQQREQQRLGTQQFRGPQGPH